MEVMTRVIKAQFPKQVIGTMTFKEINLMPQLKMGRATY
jgi:hypothetical protein